MLTRLPSLSRSCTRVLGAPRAIASIGATGSRSFTSEEELAAKAALAARLNLPTKRDIATRTKIICTLGPSSDNATQVGKLVENGMSVARLNFSHAGSDYAYAESNFELVRKATGHHSKLAVNEDASIYGAVSNVRAVLVDTKGPEVRTGPLPGGVDELQIPINCTVELHTDPTKVNDSGDPDIIKLLVDYQNISKTVKPGGQVLLDDGLIALEVLECVSDEYVVCKALNGGPIKQNKGVNLPNCTLDLPALTDKDKRDLEWAVKVGADYVAASFIRTAENVRSVIAFLERCIASLPDDHLPNGKKPLRPLVISKIESKEGVDNFDEILEESDGIMVARGDLGVEIPFSKVFAAQRMMVSECNRVGKPVIVATQMLDSMIRNPRPTRAEVTDVGTGVLDGADAVMLSGETAAGKYPIESLQAMVSVVWEADRIRAKEFPKMLWNQKLHEKMTAMEQELDSTSASAVRSARIMNAKLIVTITMSGRVARAVARHRPNVPVLAFCTDPQVARRLQLHRSVYPILLQSKLDPGSSTTSMSILRAEALRTAKELGFARAGDRIVTLDRTRGKDHDLHEYSHNMKVVTLREM